MQEKRRKNKLRLKKKTCIRNQIKTKFFGEKTRPTVTCGRPVLEIFLIQLRQFRAMLRIKGTLETSANYLALFYDNYYTGNKDRKP